MYLSEMKWKGMDLPHVA